MKENNPGARKLSVAADLFGCPNRCMHCWLGHMPNRRMEEDADRFIVDYFSPFFDSIAFYSWLREPDFCDDYADRWARDLAVSKNAAPERFELASFWRIVRDELYVPFLKSVGVEKVQLTLFGLQETQDRYVGRKGAYREILDATELLIRGGIVPRWQCFINEENREEIPELYHLYEKIRQERCHDMEFFVHEGTCDGENRKLYPVRIRKSHIPEVLIPVFLNYGQIQTERDCLEQVSQDRTSPEFPVGTDLTLYVSNGYDVFYNYTHMAKPWIIGNMKDESAETLIPRILAGDSYALRKLSRITWADLAGRFGDPSSERVFSPEDYRIYLVNRYLEED